MDLLYFVILISALIFVHELGHYAWAKIFGVKVITFSLGFGPKILRLRGKETEYCVGVIPLGGFVKMLEETKADPVLPEDRKRTFESQALWKRVVIVFAGPIMNLIFPVVLYFSVFVGERNFLPPTIGIVLPGHAADGKLQAGDRVLAVDGEEIGTYAELARIVRKSPGRELLLKVFRQASYVEVPVTPEELIERRELEMVERVGKLGIYPSLPRAVIGVPRPDSAAYRAGLRTFDVVILVGGKPIKRFVDLETALRDNRGENMPVTYLRPRAVDGALGGLVDGAVYDPGVANLTPDPAAGDLLSRTGIELADLYAAVVPDAALRQAGLMPGDKVTDLDDTPLPAWSVFRERLLSAPDQPHTLGWLRDGRRMSGTIQMRREQWTDDYGQHFDRYVMRTTHWIPSAAEPFVENPHAIRYALRNAFEETADVMRFILVGIVRVVEGRVSLSSLSGPITIYDVAGEAGARGTDYFVWAMALISINLGLLNLLPIPVLDGGHLLFFAIEAILRRPLPLRVREVASLVGMSFLFLLMGIAFKNDVDRKWDVIVGQFSELFG
ncbi:MAG TPA: RIP metalloprotease RseP [Polyangiaceae bacterium]|nr:RIP metalloprotease RseP [Polyangiaceae bacterium]